MRWNNEIWIKGFADKECRCPYFINLWFSLSRILSSSSQSQRKTKSITINIINMQSWVNVYYCCKKLLAITHDMSWYIPSPADGSSAVSWVIHSLTDSVTEWVNNSTDSVTESLTQWVWLSQCHWLTQSLSTWQWHWLLSADSHWVSQCQVSFLSVRVWVYHCVSHLLSHVLLDSSQSVIEWVTSWNGRVSRIHRPTLYGLH